MKEIFIFVDGVGLAPAAPDNPVDEDACPCLCDLIARHGVPVDACLGVDGLPQSATGQATMFTGRNAARHMGRHVEGFPGPTLRRFVEESNVFLQLKALGKTCRFADAYLADSVDSIRARRFRSVTTTMALTCPETISLKDDLFADKAVLHDITRAALAAKGYRAPLVTPSAAATHLVRLALAYDYTLFEFFLSDKAGHSGNIRMARDVLRTLDDFLREVFSLAEGHGFGVTLCSDHGNIEAMSAKGHTRNPVPLVAVGPGSDELLERAKSLEDLTPIIVSAIGRLP